MSLILFSSSKNTQVTMDMKQQETGKQDPSYSVDIHFHLPPLARASNNDLWLDFYPVAKIL